MARLGESGLLGVKFGLAMQLTELHGGGRRDLVGGGGRLPVERLHWRDGIAVHEVKHDERYSDGNNADDHYATKHNEHYPSLVWLGDGYNS